MLSGMTSITNEEYEEYRQTIITKIRAINKQIEAVESVDESFYITAKTILAVSKKAKELFLI